jgi:tRNA modification GTPase
MAVMGRSSQEDAPSGKELPGDALLGREGKIAPARAIATPGGARGETVFALASGALPAGIATVRISGPGAEAALAALAGGVPPPRQAVLRAIRDPASGEMLDRGVVLFFPAGASYTGEAVAELQLHGGRAVVAAVLAALGSLIGFRMAEPGEFTRRAFANGRLDLTAAEGIADLIGAETAAQRRQALRQADGGLQRLCEEWRRRLVRARALVEARLDFAEEDGVPGEAGVPEAERLRELARAMQAALAGAAAGERVREGFEVVILGPPNVGKSSLINALARREVAIVTAEAGTTRDLVEARLDLGGFAVTLVDTAGLRKTDSVVEREGIRRARERAAGAELVIWLSDDEAGDGAETPPPGALRVRTKADLLAETGGGGRAEGYDLTLSARTGEGLAELAERLRLAAGSSLGDGSAVMSRARHRQHVARSLEAIERALAPEQELELVAEELRLAGDEIGRLTGAVGVEEVLDVIFAEFCIGK